MAMGQVSHILFNDFIVFHPVKALFLDTLIVSNFHYYNSEHLTHKKAFVCFLDFS